MDTDDPYLLSPDNSIDLNSYIPLFLSISHGKKNIENFLEKRLFLKDGGPNYNCS